MTRIWRALQVAVVAAFSASAPAAAQDVPALSPGAVAQVGAVAISTADFHRWLAQATHSAFGRPVELLPPDYARCVAVKRQRRAARGWRDVGESELRSRCARDRRSLRRETLSFLLQAQWFEQEATLRGVIVSDRLIDRRFERERRLAFPEQGGYEEFLRRTGASEESIRYRIRLDLLQRRLVRRVVADVPAVTDGDVARYRADHRGSYAGLSPARAKRRVRALLADLREQWALARFFDRLPKRYVSITRCADGFRIPECGTAPAPGERLDKVL